MNNLLIIGSNTIHTYNYIDLVKDHFDDILLLTNSRREGCGVNSIELDFSIRPLMFMTMRKIQRIAHEFKPSAIHVHQANSFAFLTLFALRSLPVPKIVTAWGSDILVVPEANSLSKMMVQYALGQADVITSDSLYMASKIQALCRKHANIVIVNYGIHNVKERRQKENMVFSNRLHKKFYNIDKIIIAFEKFLRKNHGWKLVIAGVGKTHETKKLVKIAERLDIDGSVEFTGWLDSQDNLNYYNKSKIYVSIPDSDATSISLLEAISNNCVCFVSNLPANCEHILDHVNGFIEYDLSDIDLKKYHEIDMQLLKAVNGVRKHYYDKESCRQVFLKIYNDLLTH